MRHNQYIVKIPTETLKKSLNIAYHVKSIMPIDNQNEPGMIIFTIESEKPLKTIEGRLVTTTTLNEIRAKKKPGRPPKVKKKDKLE